MTCSSHQQALDFPQRQATHTHTRPDSITTLTPATPTARLCVSEKKPQRAAGSTSVGDPTDSQGWFQNRPETGARSTHHDRKWSSHLAPKKRHNNTSGAPSSIPPELVVRRQIPLFPELSHSLSAVTPIAHSQRCTGLLAYLASNCLSFLSRTALSLSSTQRCASARI